MRKKGKSSGNEKIQPKMIERKFINKQLEKIFSTNLFVISAAMGYGKTVAVYEFLKDKSNYDIIWFSASIYDNDEQWLWKKLSRAIGVINSKLEREFEKISFPSDNNDINNVINLLRTNITNETIIVIDDGEYLKSEKIKKVIDALVFDMIPKLHVVFITRNAPSYNYVRNEAKKQCVILWHEDFILSKEETIELFTINNINLSEEEINKIYNYTLGWVMLTYIILNNWNGDKLTFFNQCRRHIWCDS